MANQWHLILLGGNVLKIQDQKIISTYYKGILVSISVLAVVSDIEDHLATAYLHFDKYHPFSLMDNASY